MKNLTKNQLIIIAAVASAAILAGAYIFQALGYPPCKMCWWQRYPHFAAVGIGALALVTGWRVLPWLGALAAATTSAIGAYHSGVERQWWEGPTSCTSSGVEGLTPAQLMDQILGAPLVLCDQIPWRLSDMIPLEILDITMAQLNFVGSAVMALIWIAAARR